LKRVKYKPPGKKEAKLREEKQDENLLVTI